MKLKLLVFDVSRKSKEQGFIANLKLGKLT